jgi:rod shape-determining protein MreD
MESPTLIGWRTKLPLVLVSALVLHQSVLTAVQVGEVRPDLMLLVAVAAGLVGGPEKGAVVAFVVGLLTDLFLQTPLGLSALIFSLVGFAVGTVQSTVIRNAWWIPVLTGFWASAVGILLYAVVGAILGRDEFLDPHVLVVAATVGGINAVLSLPAVGVMGWALAGSSEGSR